MFCLFVLLLLLHEIDHILKGKCKWHEQSTTRSYLTIIPRVRVVYNHLISNKREWNNCVIKNAHKIWRILHDFICKNNRFSACF